MLDCKKDNNKVFLKIFPIQEWVFHQPQHNYNLNENSRNNTKTWAPYRSQRTKKVLEQLFMAVEEELRDKEGGKLISCAYIGLSDWWLSFSPSYHF